MREPMNKNRVEGARDRTSERKIAKSVSVKVTVVDPAVVRRRRSDLPRETCVAVPSVGLRGPRGSQIAAQESAEGIVGGGNEPARPEDSHRRRPERPPREGIRERQVGTRTS